MFLSGDSYDLPNLETTPSPFYPSSIGGLLPCGPRRRGSHRRLRFSALQSEHDEPVKFIQGDRFADKGERPVGESLFLHHCEGTP
jgi:hypothetical protein